MLRNTNVPERDEPTPAALAEIDAEWPLIAAEIALVDAEIRVLTASPGPSELDWRRLRRAEHHVARTAVAVFTAPARARGWAA